MVKSRIFTPEETDLPIAVKIYGTESEISTIGYLFSQGEQFLGPTLTQAALKISNSDSDTILEVVVGDYDYAGRFQEGERSVIYLDRQQMLTVENGTVSTLIHELAHFIHGPHDSLNLINVMFRPDLTDKERANILSLDRVYKSQHEELKRLRIISEDTTIEQ